MDVRFVTSNAGKFREVRELLAPGGIRVLQDRRTLPEPQADRLEPVVRAKLAAVRGGRTPVLVEDSGLFVRALHGFPGVYSAHLYRTLGYGALLDLLRGRNRTAVFRTVAGVRFGSGVRLFTGECRGTIVRRPRGSGGFGFDPVFRPVGASRTFAEMTPAEKNRYSHRARAFRRLAAYLVAFDRGSRLRTVRRRTGSKSKGTKRTAR